MHVLYRHQLEVMKASVQTASDLIRTGKANKDDVKRCVQ